MSVLAEMLVSDVRRTVCSSSISGDTPEWRYPGSHLRAPFSGSGQIATCMHPAPRFPLTSFFSSAYRLRVSNSNSGNGSIHIAASSFSIAISRFVPTIRVILLARQGSGTACWLSNRSRPLNPPPAVPPSPTAVHTRGWRRRHHVSLGTPCQNHPRVHSLRASFAPEYGKKYLVSRMSRTSQRV
jgi:hypothetical protein